VNARADDYQAARAAYASGDWVDVLRHAGAALAREPLHAGAAELVIAARRAVEVGERSRGERRLLTVVFCDLVGSTALVADLGPETYRELMLEVHDLCVRAVTEYEGRIAQFLGDGVLAYFSYPQAHEDDARRAILAALSIVSEIRSREAGFVARFGRAVACRIGIDSGNLVVGALGSGQWKTSDSIVGDAANIAARLQTC
jgi:class 3 adenylate cyclase